MERLGNAVVCDVGIVPGCIAVYCRPANSLTMIIRSMLKLALAPIGLFLLISQVVGQAPVRPPVMPPAKKLPPPQTVALKRTRDGVQLSAMYYPTKLEKDERKEAVPVILLH